MATLLTDIIEPEIQFTVEESESEVDGVYVLGKVKGQFFVPDGYSRNNRYYPRKLWEKVISDKEIQKKLKEKRMFGTIGHDIPINDTSIAEGKISHIVTNLYIDEQGRGIGEALILNTPAGRVLNTLLRAGAKLYVSSRAYGEYEGKDPTGKVPALKPETYQLITFDFVYDPGFLQANPQLVESIKEDFKQCIGDICDIMSSSNNNSKSESKKEEEMGLEMAIEQLTKEKVELEKELDKVLKENEELKKKIEELSKKEDEVKSVKESLAKTEEELKVAKEELAKYEKLGKPEEIEKTIKEAKEILQKYSQLGSPEEIEQAIKDAKSALEEYKEFGTPDELKEVLEKSKAELEKILQFQEEVGSLDEVREFLNSMKDVLSRMVEEKKAKQVEELAKEYGVDKEVVERLVGRMDIEEVKDVLSRMVETNKYTMKYKVKNDKANEDNKNIEAKFKQPRAVRIAESFLK
jgi:hypothetical protein